MTAVRRLRQGVRALLAFAQPVDYALAAEYLGPPLLARFRQMRRSEQLHSLRVLRALLAEGDVSHDLAVAALLHDGGQPLDAMPLWQRSRPVIVRRLSPQLLLRLSQGDPRSRWRRGFVVYVQHPAWSAELIRRGGGDEAAVWLSAHHADGLSAWYDRPLAGHLARLQAADDVN